MTDQQRTAHIRLMQELPVRTHAGPTDESKCNWSFGRVRTDAQCAQMRKKVRAMRKKLSVAKIAKKLVLSRQAVYDYLRKR